MHFVLIIPAIQIDVRRSVYLLRSAAAVSRRTRLAPPLLMSTLQPSNSTRLSTSHPTGYNHSQLTSGGRVGPQLFPPSSGFGLDRRNADRGLAGGCRAISGGRF